MKNLICSVLSLVIFSFFAKAQTWTGNTSTDWNTGSNWSGNAVPLAGANVTIPTAPAGNRWPKLGSNISLSGFGMQAGAQLDINGFTITATHLDWRGSISNSNIGTDIVVNITGTSTTFIRNFSASDHITYTLSGTGIFYDTYLANTQNSYTGDVTYNRTGTGATYVARYSTITYGGNVTLNRATGSETESFYAGSNIAGNLNILSAGGRTIIGDATLISATRVAGQVNMNVNTGNEFGMYRVINQTNGGSITISDRTACQFYNDTLKVSAITITGNTSTFDLLRSDLTCNLSYASAPSHSTTHYVRNTVVTGTASYTLAGSHVFYDTYLANTQNIYTGDVTYNRTGTGSTYLAFYSTNTYGGNLTFNRAAGNETESFYAGSNIAGNLNITSAGGRTIIGDPALGFATRVGGQVNMNVNTGSEFGMYRVINQTNGGSITLSDRAACQIFNDTLKVSAITITGNTSTFDLLRSDLTGNLSYASSATNTATHYVRNTVVTGTASYTLAGSQVFYDTYLANTGNSYTGNVSYTRTGTGAMYVGYYDTVSYGGNLAFNFNTGATYDHRTIAFTGSTPATLSQDGNAPLQFLSLAMEKTGGASLTLDDSVRIVNNVQFGGGNIITANQKELIWLNGATTGGASDESKVVGPIIKIGAQAFNFPIGNSTRLQTVAMTAPVGTTSRFRCEYVFSNPHPTYDTSMRAAGLTAISGCEYWRVLREIGATNVALTFDYGAPCLCVEVPANLRVAKWNGSQWTNLGNGGTTGDISGGTVKPTAAVTDYGVFSLGTSATVSPTLSIGSNVSNPVCLCRKVTFTATATLAGCTPSFQWKKNNANVGTNSPSYEDSTLQNGDVITCVLTSSAAFAQPASLLSNSINITTTDANTWTGATSSNWHTPANWSCQSVPCIFTKVTIAGSTPSACEILSGNVRVVNLTNNANSVFRLLNGSTLELKPAQ